MTILDVKINLHEELKQSCKRDIPVERWVQKRKSAIRNLHGCVDIVIMECKYTSPSPRMLQSSVRNGCMIIAIFVFTRMRLRKKSWKSPGRIYRNEKKLDDVVIYSGTFELFVEELQGRFRSYRDKPQVVYIRQPCIYINS
jgi:hypothetical protein